jgi:purine-binding chemotaxis protein CheW
MIDPFKQTETLQDALLETEEIRETIQICLFKLGNTQLGIYALKIQEIIKVLEITPVPTTPDFLLGVINLRGDIIPVADIREVLELSPRATSKENRILIVNLEGEKIGFMVDAVLGVYHVEKDFIEPSYIQSPISNLQFVSQMIKFQDDFIVLLDFDKIYEKIRL